MGSTVRLSGVGGVAYIAGGRLIRWSRGGLDFSSWVSSSKSKMLVLLLFELWGLRRSRKYDTVLSEDHMSGVNVV